jgi:copper chaperone CopZ
MIDPSHNRRVREIHLSIVSISCLTCTPAFKRGLERVNGIRNVRQLPMLNKMIVDYDPERSDEAEINQEILRAAEKAGLKGKVIISR